MTLNNAIAENVKLCEEIRDLQKQRDHLKKQIEELQCINQEFRDQDIRGEDN